MKRATFILTSLLLAPHRHGLCLLRPDVSKTGQILDNSDDMKSVRLLT